jgi:alpha-N-arabinofuranosidase
MLQQIGTSALRWPGGSTSDGYHWASDPSGNATFQNLATNLGAQVFTTINYGSGTPAEAAAWVLMANQTNQCGFQYWEIGNECYGSWENDTHAIPHDPYTYATNAVACIQQMKAAYPAVPIKIGVVVVPGEGSYSNNATHFAVNPRTGTTNYGWTPIVLSVMNSLGVTPDFLIYHDYPQYTSSGWTYYSGSPDSDPLLLQVAENPSPSNWSDWVSAAADLRQQIIDYIGTSGGNIELCVTENNGDAGAMGRQSTSLVNALYLADSTSALMKTEFRSYIWWDLHNGYETDGNFDPTIYGWRSNGDYGILSGANSPYPTFYAEKLLQHFARPGDTVLAASSDNLLLSAYAVRRTNGALTLLVINKDMTTNLTAQVALTNFVPWSTASLLSYGIPQDQAAETNGAAALQDLAGGSYPSAAASFNYTFAPLSLTLFTFAPGAATLAVQTVQPGQVQLLLQGQPGTPYVIQSSPDLLNWNSVATNILTGSSVSIPVPVLPGAATQFFRAVWQP